MSDYLCYCCHFWLTLLQTVWLCYDSNPGPQHSGRHTAGDDVLKAPVRFCCDDKKKWQWFYLIFLVSLCCSSVLSQVVVVSTLQAVKVSPLIERVSDHKDFRKLLRTRTNVLVLYTKSGECRTSVIEYSDVSIAASNPGATQTNLS